MKKHAPLGPNEVIDFKGDESITFSDGDLSDLINSDISAGTVLSAEEEDQIIQVKKKIKQFVEEYESRKILYKAMLNPEPGQKVDLTLQNQETGILRTATPLDVKKMCETSRENVFIFAEFLGGKASKLSKAYHLDRAQAEFKIAQDALIQVYGKKHLKTQGLVLDYALVLIRNGKDDGLELLQNMIKQLEPELSAPNCDLEIKKILAIADLALARHYLNSNNPNPALIHCDRSEKLRQEYNADASEMDRVKFIRASIEYIKGNIDNAKKLFAECYQFRSTLGEYSSELLPILDYLINIAEAKNKPDQKVIYLARKRDIKIQLANPVREIINIEFEIIQAMALETNEQEWWNVMESLEDRLNKIPVTAESADIGLNYLTLAETRISMILPHNWPAEKKIKHYADTIALIYKANGHLNQNEKLNETTHWRWRIDSVKSRCLMGKNFFSENQHLYLFEENVADNSESEKQFFEELKNLSEFSSEVRQSIVDPEDRILTVAEFEALPERGIINPCKLRVAQGGINAEFRDGKSLDTTKQALVADPRYTNQIPAIQIGIHNGKVFSFDTRRLIVHQQAREQNENVNIRYEKISGPALEKRVNDVYSKRPWNGLVTALRYGGKNSESTPYINPTFRAQLEDHVRKGFVNWPSDRMAAHADPNGFCLQKASAKKIYLFLVEKKNQGSDSAKKIIDEAMEIHNTQGKPAFYEFLTHKKIEMDLATEDNHLHDDKRSSSSEGRRFTI